MIIRLNKFISQAGVASRREADKKIEQGRVRVNGRVIQQLGLKIDDKEDKIEIDGIKIVKDSKLVYIMLNKPEGYLVTAKDPLKRSTVMQLLPGMRTRIFSVGRLDLNSKGLLLLTNDGEMSNRLLHPSYKVKKVYRVMVKGRPDATILRKLRKGIILDRRKTAPAKISPIWNDQKKTLLSVEIYEGRKREIRRMFAALGFLVIDLKRIHFARLSLGKLKLGQWRYLTSGEVKKLREMVGLN